MRKLFWMIFLLGAYFWVVTSGHDGILLEKGTALYKGIVAWFDDAEVDCQLKVEKSKKRCRSRRWD